MNPSATQHRYLLLLGLSLLLATGCHPDACDDDPKWTGNTLPRHSVPREYDVVPVQVDGIEGVIVPAEAAAFRKRALSHGTWTPTAVEVAIFERSGCAERAIEGCRNNELRSEDYVRQYEGNHFPFGRAVYAYLMCEPIEGWRSQIVYVRDGGCCYISVDYNLDTEECMFYGEGSD